MSLNKITPQFIESLFKKWHKGDFSAEDLEILQIVPTDAEKVENANLRLRERLYQRVQANLSGESFEAVASQKHARNVQALEKLFRDPPSDFHFFALIHYRYLDVRKYSAQELADLIGISSRTLRRYILKGFEKLSLQIKNDLDQNSIKKNLSDHFPPMAKNQVVGLEKILANLNALLLNKNSQHAISIEGIGGIGKTLVAQFLLETQYKKANFEGYAWVNAIQKELSLSGEIAPLDNFATTLDDVVARLTNQLGQSHLAGLSTENKLNGLKKLTAKKSFLIIIDNLETLEDANNLVPELLKIRGKSKLVFTSRKSLSQYPDLRVFPIPELSLQDSFTLVDGEIKRRGLSLSLSDSIISALYDVTGGIPLVLKLAAAQFGFIPAKDIISQLRLGEAKSQNMYYYIYRQAWMLLNEQGKKLLLSMLLVSPDGEDREWICDMGELSIDEFNEGLTQLKRLSLIEFSGSVEIPRYHIHRLTISFLRTDIINGWEENKTS